MEEVSEIEKPASAVTLTRVAQVLILTVLGVGLVLRLRGFAIGTIALWEDEAAWATRLVEQPILSHDIRPLGFMALSKLLVNVLEPSETVLRALPWLAGVGSLVMAPFLAKRLFASLAAQLLFVAIIALHPAAIDLAKEFKPYSVGLALHMGLLLLTLRFLDEGKHRDLALLLGLLFAGTLFAQDALFTYPGIFGLLLLTTFRTGRVREFGAVALGALMTAALLGTLYFAMWRHSVGKEATHYWGKKYDVFYVKTPDASRLGWTTERLLELAALPGMRSKHWKNQRVSEPALDELKQVDSSVWQALGVLGLGGLLYHRRRRELVLVAGPLAVVLVMNRFGFWPLGAFRTNLFALVYVAALAAAALDRRSGARDAWEFVPASVLVLLPFLLLGNTKHANKWAMSSDSAFPSALQALEGLRSDPGRRGRSVLVLDASSCTPFRYYTRIHPESGQLRHDIAHFDAHCTKDFDGIVRLLRKGLTSDESRSFALVSRVSIMAELERRLPEDLQVDAQQRFGKDDQLVVRVKRRS